ncbi:hypothetical protein OROHE_015695 [Orobanche hederae]
MADYGSQPEISILKDTLCAQQHLLQRLYNELDAERESSATAASEALSVILRLQGEKAAVKMEAEQYKRLAEEKMCHAEESFAVIEDIIYQKEMEVAALDYQVQAYRYKLLSMGCAGPGGGEIRFPENLLQRSESLTRDSSSHGRRNPTPALLKYKKAMIERESSLSPEPDFISKNTVEQMGQEITESGSDIDKKADSSTHGGCIMSYGEEIRKLNIRVKEIAGANYSCSRYELQSPSSLSSRPSAGNLGYLSYLQPEARSPSPQISNGNPYSPKVALVNEIDQIKQHSRTPKKGEAASYPCSPSVHDVFEVPQVDQYVPSPNDRKRTESKDFLHPEAVKLSAKVESDWLKKLFLSTGNEKSLCKPSHTVSVDRAIVQPTMGSGESRPGLNLLNEILGTYDVERVRGESNSREEELKLLKEIKEQINLLKDEIRSQKSKKFFVGQKSSLCSLPESNALFLALMEQKVPVIFRIFLEQSLQ